MVTTMNGSSGGGGDESDSSSIQQQQTITISSVTSNNNALVVEHSLDDDDDDGMSDDSGPDFSNSADLMHATMEDEVTAQLAAAGPVGMAAAAAIASAKKRKRPHQFETNPSIRKRQQTRLLRKLRQTIDEFTIRVGMQAVVLVAIPGKPQNSFKCFGAKPLEDVIRNLRPVVMQDLESALAQHAPAPAPEDPSLHELPPLVIDGIPTPVEKMTQAQLRAFIPLMLKYSTGRGKPGWGKESTRPPWWPQDLPWANVRMDARTEDEKQKVSWTHALRQIVINCYKYHGREDLLPVFNADNEEASNNNNTSSNVHNNSSNTNNTVSSNNMVDIKPPPAKIPKSSPQNQIQQIQTVTAQAIPQYGVVGAHGFQPTVLQTISNPDGTVSIIQVDPTNSIITLPDGTTAQVQGLATLQQGGGGDGHHHHHSDDSHHHHTTHHQLIQQQDLTGMTVDLNSVAQATLGQEGQIILTGEDGHAYPVTVSGMITVPVNASMYQTVVANISSVQQPDGSMQTKFILPSTTTTHIQQPKQRLSARQTVSRVVTPMVLPKVEPGTEHETTTIPVSALTGDPSQTQLVTVNANGQVVHDNKIYQICEFQRAENQEKVIMMAEVTPSPSHHHQQQSQGQEDQQQVQSKDTSNSSSGSPSSIPSDQQQQSIGVSEQQQQQQQQQTS